MVPHLILLFGLSCAGVLANLDSRNYGGASDDRSSSESFWTNFDRRANDCNLCLRTVNEMIRMIKDMKKPDLHRNNLYLCSSFGRKQNEICRSVLSFVREYLLHHNTDVRKICARTNYCITKHKPKEIPAVPMFVSPSKDKSGYQSELGKTRCEAKKNDDNSESTGVPKEPPLDSVSYKSKCRKCEAVMKEIGNYIDHAEPRAHILPYACSSLEETTSDYCFNLVQEKGDEIIQHLAAKKQNSDICYAIDECRRPLYSYCNICQKYIYYVNLMGFDSDSWEDWACSDASGNYKGQCVSLLLEKKASMHELLADYPKLSANGICQAVRLCPPKLLASEPHNQCSLVLSPPGSAENPIKIKCL